MTLFQSKSKFSSLTPLHSADSKSHSHTPLSLSFPEDSSVSFQPYAPRNIAYSLDPLVCIRDAVRREMPWTTKNFRFEVKRPNQAYISPLPFLDMFASLQAPSALPARGKFKPRPKPNTNLSLLHLSTLLKEAKQIHGLMIKSSQITDTYSASRLAEFYANSDNGNLNYAEKILQSVQEPYTFLWNSIMRGYIKNQNPFQATLLYNQMLHYSVEPDHFTFTIILKACTQLPSFEFGKQIHCQVVKYREDFRPYIRNKLIHLYAVSGPIESARKLFDTSTELDIVAWNSMLDCYADNGDEESLHGLFDRMPVKDVVTWNTMIAFYVQTGDFLSAIDVFRKMQDSGENPDRVTLISALSAVASLGALAQGRWIHSYINKHKVLLDENLGSALVNMYSKCGCINGAIQAFDETRKKSVDTWNAMISGLAANGESMKALEYFSKMESAKAWPNVITFSGVLNACSHGGLVEDGSRFFRKMTDVYGIKPDIGHYGCMVDLFGRAGLFDKAEEMIRTMPMKPDAAMWKALLSASRIHRNLEMGERAGLRLIDLAPDDHASYILLSNIYAMGNNWGEAHKARNAMLERGIEKPPGSSSVESDGIVHEFMVGDTVHPQKKDIYSMLDEMWEKLKLAGYEPKTEEVLLDIEEERVKQSSLYHHSEKLAVAFGFISTKPTTTIRVINNIRICSDCHCVMKLLSKIYNRDIIIRDSKRFHHFRDGSCSCKDYW